MEIKQSFVSAIHDYQYFLNRGYPQKSILKIVGDKYRLSGKERSILYRGVCSDEQMKNRKLRIVKESKPVDLKIHIDTYNVLLIIGSYLNGSLVFISLDGFLRDASELHGRKFRKDIMQKSEEVLFNYLQSLQISEFNFYIDEPISFSGKLCNHLQNRIEQLGLKGEARTVKSPDCFLKNLHDGLIATADSVVIDQAEPLIIDLPRNALLHQFSPQFLDLSKF